MNSGKLLFTLFLISLLCVPVLSAQIFDYDKFPKLDFKTEHLEGDLRVDDRVTIEGDIEYTIRFQIGNIDSLVLHAVKMTVEDVLFNDRTADFEVVDDQLVIFIDEEIQRNDVATVRIRYTAEPLFGIHQNYLGTVFTSLLPTSSRHWLPGIDHPSLSFTTDLSFIHPSARQVISNGGLENNEVAAVDEESTTFRNRFPVTPASLFLAIGEFENTVIENSNYTVIISSEVPGIDQDQAENLAAAAIELMEYFTDYTGADYPYSALRIVILNDLKWEVRNYAGGIVLADLDQNLEDQVKYGVIGQWAGLIASEMQWSEPEAVQILKGYLANAAGTELSGDWQKTVDESLYNAFHIADLDKWKYYLTSNPDLESVIEISLDRLFSGGGTHYDWTSFSRILYETTGQPFFDSPRFTLPEREVESEYRYFAQMDWDEVENEVVIRFTAEGDAVDELVTVNAIEYSLNERRERTLDFTGTEEEVVVSVTPGIENLQLKITERDDVSLDQEKPFMFWIYQVQNDNNPENRAEAAVGLRQYTDNPDLQLALLDMLNIETNPIVYAEMIRTLSFATAGASGTEQIFLERGTTNQPEVIQAASATALAAYSGNHQAISRLRGLAQNSEYEEVRRRSLAALADITEPSNYRNIVETLMLRDNLLQEVPYMLTLLAEAGEIESAVRFSETFLSREFPIEVRLAVLDLVLEHDQSARSWENRLENLLRDRDPRIRYRVADALGRVSAEVRNDLVKKILPEEFDERVYRKISGN